MPFSLWDPDLGTLELDETNGVVVEKFDLGYPNVRENVKSNPNADGVADRSQFLGERVVSLDMAIFTANKAANMQAIRSYCHPSRRPILTFTLDNSGTLYQIPLRISESRMPIESSSSYRMQLAGKAPPFYTSPTISGAATDADDTIIAGLTFPLTFNFTLGGAGSSSSIYIYNTGHASLWPTYEIRGPVTNPVIINKTTGEQIVFTGLAIADNDIMYVDPLRGTVVLNDTDFASYVDYSVSTWFDANVGTTQIQLQGFGTDVNTAIFAYWAIPYL